MTRNLLLPLAALVLALGSTACKKDPETEPRDLITDSLEWDSVDKTGTVAAYFLTDLYSYLPNGFNRLGDSPGDFLAGASGDAIPSRYGRTVEYFTNGALNASNNPDQYYATAYAGIRRANIYLSNIDRVPVTALVIQYGKAEARFIRAMQYFEMLKRYGGVPLVGDKVFTLSDNLNLPRNTFEDCVNYIVSECNAISPLLRTDAALADGDWGRITQGCALALKSRVLLYAASPLYNGGQAAGAGALQGYTSYSAARWQAAYDAAQAVVALNYFAFNAATAGSAVPYQNIFTTKRNKEVILAKQAANSTTLENNNAPIGYSSPAVSYGYTSPTQDFVDAFPTLTGLAISTTGSGYNAASPYAGRDPRLLASVFTNGTGTAAAPVGSRWLSRNVETFDGGQDRPGGTAVQTRTGYYLRKFLGDFSTSTTYSNTSHNYPIFRYAEIQLNAAEALNELGRTEEAVARIVLIRTRSGLTAGTGSRYGIPVSISQSAMRDLIRNERRIELGFEDHRFWDVRRWKLAPTVLNGPLYGVQITRGGTSAAYTYTYIYLVASTTTWQDRLYYLPLPFDETLKNPSLTQNPGW